MVRDSRTVVPGSAAGAKARKSGDPNGKTQAGSPP
jgi:hypothetical protein